MSETIMSTKDYSKFERYDINRKVDIDSRDFKDLVKSMKTYGFMSEYPLGVIQNGGGKLKIISGNNRYDAAQLAGVPVKYVISTSGAPIHAREVGPGKWKQSNYLESFSKNGAESYQVLEEYMERTGIGLNNAASMLFGHTAGAGGFKKNHKFISGKFQIKDRKHAEDVADVVLFLANIGIEWARSDNFVKSLSRALKVPEFNIERFKSKSVTFRQLYEKQPSLKKYMELVETIYNYKAHSKDKLNVVFLANKYAAERNAAKQARG